MAWNEPGGDNKGKNPWDNNKQQKPPDLDELLKKAQQKLRAIFSTKKSANGEGKKSSGGFGIGLIILIAVIVWALSGIYIVKPAEQAVVLRFGKYVKTVDAGPHWIPRFIYSKRIVNVERIYNYAYAAEMLNMDENIVSVAVAIQYRIGDPKQFLFNVIDPVESLQQTTASSLRQVVGHTALDEVLTTGREQIRQEVSEVLNRVLDRYHTGLIITDVAMQPAQPPDPVKPAFDDAIKAQEDEQRYINEAQAYEAQVKPIAQGQARRIIEEANAYKQRVTLDSEGAAARFLEILSAYESAPTVTRDRLYLDAISNVLSNSSKIVVDVEGGNNMLYFPLDRLMEN
ncbi:MAG: FtsH protease activity modulator HflK, partial [Gammaproteobacteria bacterium]